jgi:hypothetical protein
MVTDYEQYLGDLAEVIRAGDKGQIEAFFVAHGIPTASTEEGFWGGVHKLRLSLPDFSEAEKEESRRWLRENGMKPKASVPENLQRYIAVFSAKCEDAEARGLSEAEAAREAAAEANRLHPLTREDKEALRFRMSLSQQF